MTPVTYLHDPVEKHIPVSMHPSENRRRITITAAWSFVDAGHCFPEGVSEAVVYESDLEALKKRIADPVELTPNHWQTDDSKIEEAKRIVEENKRTFLEANPGREWKHVARKYTGPRTWHEAYIQRNYHFADGAGYKSVHPIRELRVHDEVLPPPLTETERKQQAQMTALATAVAKAMRAGAADVSDAEPERTRRPR